MDERVIFKAVFLTACECTFSRTMAMKRNVSLIIPSVDFKGCFHGHCPSDANNQGTLGIGDTGSHLLEEVSTAHVFLTYNIQHLQL